MKKIVLFRKFLSFFLIISLILNFIIPALHAVETNGTSTPWTMQKAEHLAARALIGTNPEIIKDLYNAGSAVNAVNLLFPSVNGPDRTQYLSDLATFKGDTFNVSDTNQNRQVYAFNNYADPYEAKRKLFGLFEDIFPIDRTGGGTNDINFPDIDNHFKILYEESLGNYKKMIKRVLFDSQNPENSFAMGRYLDLLNGPDKNYPNENYARELVQLFLMLEYKPREDAESTGAIRNYEELDVASLARILTGFRSAEDKKVFFDLNNHNTSTGIVFLTGSLKSGDNFSFYNSASGTIDNTKIVTSIGGNNGLGDNIVDYIFSKREAEIAYFLSWRLLKYYAFDKPTKIEIETLANILLQNNFNLYPTIKWLLSSDLMYSEKSMNSLRYKNPLELTIGTLKLLHYKNPSFVVDPLLKDSSLLSNLEWTPYNPRSIFGRDGFDNNANFMNAYFHNQWVTYASKLAFTTGTGYYDLADLLPITTYTNSGIVSIKTNTGNTYSGSINLSNISITLSQNIFQDVVNAESNITSLQEDNSKSQDIIQNISEIEEIIDTPTNSGSVSPELPKETQLEKIPTIENDSSTGNLKQESKDFDLTSFVFPKANADIVNANTITFSTGIVVFPDFYIQTNSGKIYLEGSFDSKNGQLNISSGTLLYGTGNYSISSSSMNVNSSYSLQRDITIDELISQFEKYLYLGKKLPESVRSEVKNFLLKDQNGVDRLFLPNNKNYRDKYIRSILSILLVQPEFLLQSGYDLPQVNNNSGDSQINDSSKKLIMVELYGGYDWMNGVIPKTDFNYYKDIRGDLAFGTGNLIDLGEVYLNKNFESFYPFFQSGELRIVNRVGAPNHSRGHDTAAIQVASQKALQTVGTPGLIGELIKNETNPLNNIVLGTNKPPIYTNGNYINIGGNSILYKNNTYTITQSEKDYQLLTLKNILNNRTYPSVTDKNFKNSVTLDNVGASGQSSVGYTLSGRLNFTKGLIDNGLGITYYVPGGGGYDTHGDQQKAGTYNLNDRTKDLANDISSFFNQMKASNKDVTIVIYSEFGRTLKANGTVGTDHGEGGGYFILSTNNSLKSALPNKIIGKISPEKEYEDWFGVGVDYRSIYTKILKSLYNVNVSDFFLGDYKLEDDLNTDIPNPVLFRTEYRNSWWGNVNVDIKFKVDDKNFIFKDGSYLKLYYGTDKDNLKEYSSRQMENYTYVPEDNSFKINLGLSKGKTYFYKLEIVDNQYDSYTASGSFVVPSKFESDSVNNIVPLTTNSYFAKYDNTPVSGNKTINKLVVLNNPVEEIINTGSTNTGITNTGTITYSGSVKDVSFTGGIVLTFGTGETFIDTLTNSGIWNGGFVLPNFINKNEFITDKASFNGDNLKFLPIENILKVGADSLGVGMKLNQNVKITLPISSSNGIYKIITSEDGLNWSEVNNVNQVGNNVSFSTNQFSYFALYNGKLTDIVPTPDGGGGSSGGSPSSGGGGGGGGGSVAKDYCPTGDFSPSYYDGKCGEKPQTSTGNTVIIKDKTYIQNLKTQIMANRLEAKKQNLGTIKTTNIGTYNITEISGYKLSDKMKAISLWIIKNKKISASDKQKYIQRLNDFLQAKYDLESASVKTQDLKNKYNKQIILIKPVLSKLKKL